MNFAEMNKEQKQLLILAVGGAFTLIMITSNLLVKPTQKRAEAAEKIIEELATDVSRGELLLERDARVRAKTREDAQALLKIVEEQLPPESGRYGWALENLTEVAESVGVLFSVREHRGARFVPLKSGQEFNPDSIPMWIPYPVEVEFRTSFENLKKILNLIEQKFPYCSVANMQINASERDPENHNISLILEWPVFRLESDKTWIEKQAKASL